MPAVDLVVTGTRVYAGGALRRAAIVVQGGVITEVTDPGASPDARDRFDAGDAAVLPGAVDTHVHVNDPGRTDWEGFASATRAAAAGGVTTIVDMPLNSIPATCTVAALQEKVRCARGEALVDFGLWGGAVPDHLDDLADVYAAGALGFKCFLVPSGVPEFPHLDRRALRAAMDRIAELDAVLLVHAELPEPIARAGPPRGDPRSHATWLGSRPPEAELEAIGLVLDLARRTGCRVHIVHLSSADGAVAATHARRGGVRVTVESCPHYLTFAAERVPDGATAFKCAPPIREAANREQLWDALADGSIDLVASDHSPCPPAMKALEAGDFLAAWGGIASLELLLAATWTGARARGHTLEALVRWLCERPAHLAGIADRKGAIAPGHDADLVVFDPDAAWTVDPTRLHQRHPLTPYAGMALFGRVRRTYVRGSCVYDGEGFPQDRDGRWMKRAGAAAS